MTPPLPAPQSPFQHAISQLTADVKPHVLRTMHGLISTALTATLTSTDGDRAEQQAEARAMARFLRDIETNLGGTSFSAVQPQQRIAYVTPSQLPGAAASEPKKQTRRATPRGKKTPP